MNYIELYKLGGTQLIITVAFIIFMWWMVKYFISQIQETKEHEKELRVQYILERDGAHKLFNDALKTNNEAVKETLDRMITALEKQEKAFQDVIIMFKVELKDKNESIPTSSDIRM